MGGQAGGQMAAEAPFMPQFGGFMNDQTAQMGFQVGQKAVMAGQEYVEQSVRPLQSSARAPAESYPTCNRSIATSPSPP